VRSPGHHATRCRLERWRSQYSRPQCGGWPVLPPPRRAEYTLPLFWVHSRTLAQPTGPSPAPVFGRGGTPRRARSTPRALDPELARSATPRLVARSGGCASCISSAASVLDRCRRRAAGGRRPGRFQ
jgi:hypothetical protein